MMPQLKHAEASKETDGGRDPGRAQCHAGHHQDGGEADQDAAEEKAALVPAAKFPKWKRIMAWGIPYSPEINLLTAPVSLEGRSLPKNPPVKNPKSHSLSLARRESPRDKEKPPFEKPLPVDQKPKVQPPRPLTAISRFRSNSGTPDQSLSESRVRAKDGQPKPHGQQSGFLLRDLLLFGKKA
jgi:hypothetical protein